MNESLCWLHEDCILEYQHEGECRFHRAHPATMIGRQ